MVLKRLAMPRLRKTLRNKSSLIETVPLFAYILQNLGEIFMQINKGLILAISILSASFSVKAETEIDLSDVGFVALENTGAPEAQQAFLHGLAQLHNFQYGDAAEDFQAAQAIDPDFALAYWGEALTYTHAIWMEKDSDAAKVALNKFAPSPEARQEKAATEFARDMLAAVDILYGPGTKEEQDDKYMSKMAELFVKYPDNVEVASMYALSIMGTAHEGREFSLYMETAAIVTEFIKAYPGHPGLNHYLIHATDDPIHAPLGLRAAHAYSKIAPNAGHPQHMTSHIFLALGMWDDFIRANVRAVDINNQQRDEPPVHRFTCSHYTSWLMYGYLQVDQRDAAHEIMTSCHQWREDKPLEDRNWAFYYPWMRALYLNDTGEWNGDVAAMEMAFPRDSDALMANIFLAALVEIKLGNIDASRAALENAYEAAEERSKSWDEMDLPADHASRKETKIQLDQLEAQVLLLSGDDEAAVALLRQAVAMEMDLPFGFGPPYPAKPGLELLGEVLVEIGQFEEAKEVLALALSRTKGKALVLIALAKAEAGLKSK